MTQTETVTTAASTARCKGCHGVLHATRRANLIKVIAIHATTCPKK